ITCSLGRRWVRACSNAVESWPPEQPTITRLSAAKTWGSCLADARSARASASRARTTSAKEVLPPLAPGRWRWSRGWARLSRSRRLGPTGDQHNRPLAWFDQAQLFAGDGFDRRVTARLLDVLLQANVLVAQGDHVRAQA